MTLRVPFGAVLQPLLHDSVARLDAGGPDRSGLVSEHAMFGLTTRLANVLARATTPSLLDRFHSREEWQGPNPNAHAAHDRFVASLCAGGFDDLIDSSPTLRRIIEERRNDWLRSVTAMLDDLSGERTRLAETFGFRLPAVEISQSGDTAFELTDRNGTRIVHKQRRVAMDVAFGHLLDDVNALGPSLDLTSPTTLDRGTHGWAEFVDHRPPSHPGERADYYRRAGMLLCLTHLLGGGDIHDSNLRVRDGHPVLIDAEKLLRPGIGSAATDHPDVTSTQLLPTVPGYERCGLAAELYVRRPRRWLDVGTDGVRQRPIRRWLDDMGPRSLDHLRREARRAVTHMTAGFCEIYAMVRSNGLPIEVFDECRTRLLLRPTIDYDELIERSVSPENLTESAHHELVENFVARPLVLDRLGPDARRAVAAAERTVLTRQRAPRFWCPVSGRSLITGVGRVDDAFASSPGERARRFLGHMSGAQRDRQVDSIEESFAELESSSTHLTLAYTASVVPLEELFS